MNIEMKPITRKDKKVKELYRDSFPKEERMSFLFMLLMSKMKNTDFLSFYDNDVLCGLVYMATVDAITFIMFLAVDKSVRSKGYGSAILEKIQLLYPENKIIVSIEQCDEEAKNREERLKRKNFYLKNDYRETGYFIELEKVEQEVLIKNGEFDKEEFTIFFKKYSNGAMNPKMWKSDSK